MNAQGPEIEVNGLWKVFGNKPERALQPEYAAKSRDEIQEELGLVVGLRDVSFSVDKGEIYVVMGLSGSGKSTLVRCLIRLIEATQGQIHFDGEDILTYSPERLIEFRRQKVAMVFQHYGLLPNRCVIDNVSLGLEIQGVDKRTRYAMASQAIETVGLKGWENYYPREMSGGMQQRVGLARALAVNPDVLLMDEPFSGLDPLIRREMQDELISLETELNKTIVFITHDLDEALKLGDRIAIMRDGEIIQEGSPEEIVTLPTDRYVSEFVQDVSRAKVIQAKAIMREPDAVVYERQGPRAALHLMQRHDVRAIFLIARDFILRGILTEAQAQDLVAEGRESLYGAPIESAITVDPEAYVEDVIPMAAQTEYRIAVVGDNGSLLGEIHKSALLEGIAARDREM
ncbi:MAG: glycine betaine/L-proline ABC transporter ATP-binding protein [Chloroflexi bacterium]|nr:glycine betaine/L-proline ABC transporter ATP-binding protein [Chloroflexota bacterium]MCY3937478.1 glycine betaine/L-proline ABC transporter ATP-binding protein [Chloroflexota bacterium]